MIVTPDNIHHSIHVIVNIAKVHCNLSTKGRSCPNESKSALDTTAERLMFPQCFLWFSIWRVFLTWLRLVTILHLTVADLAFRRRVMSSYRCTLCNSTQYNVIRSQPLWNSISRWKIGIAVCNMHKMWLVNICLHARDHMIVIRQHLYVGLCLMCESVTPWWPCV